MIKKLTAAVLALCMVLSLSGCGETKTEEADTGSVYWLNNNEAAQQSLEMLASVYKANTGVDVRVETVPADTYFYRLSSQLKSEDAPTIFMAGTAAAAESLSESCLDLKGTPVYGELQTDAFTRYTSDGKAASIPVSYDCFGIIVDVELLNYAGHRLSEIKNFAGLRDVARDIHERADSLGFDAFTSSGLDDAFAWRFTGELANIPLYYESEDSGVWTECPEEIMGTYLDNFKLLFDLYVENSQTDPSRLAAGGFDPGVEFMSRRAVFYQSGAWEYEAFKQVFDDSELAMIPMYCGVAGEDNVGLCCDTENCWAVNSQASQADIQASLDFMYWIVTSEEGTKILSEFYGIIPYKKNVGSENVFRQDAADLMAAGKYPVTWAFKLTPDTAAWRSELARALGEYTSGADWSVVEDAFVNGWASHYKIQAGSQN